MNSKIKVMKMRYFLVLLVAIVSYSCGSSSEDKEINNLEGNWTAKWSTDPASFGEIEGISDYTMDGNFIFENQMLNIKAYGFEGCVFSTDTLDHNLMWSVSGDSLVLINDDETPGMVYQIKSKTEEKIELQLLDDIMLTLTK
ncbi:MAG: hypothetical protein ACI9A7_000228 [Cyclobacteriaceae bacterium]|jgi:hypothetical protein